MVFILILLVYSMHCMNFLTSSSSVSSCSSRWRAARILGNNYVYRSPIGQYGGMVFGNFSPPLGYFWFKVPGSRPLEIFVALYQLGHSLKS